MKTNQLLIRVYRRSSAAIGFLSAPRYPSATTGLTSRPMPSTCTAASSPGSSHRGGLRAKPTPAGVPVEIRSPGSRVITLERNAISWGTPKIRLLVLELCISSPLRVSEMASLCGSSISSAVTMTGPMGANVSNVFPMVHWLVGVFLVLRRLIFMGVALPQISSTGVAVALSLPLWLGMDMSGHDSQSAHVLAFAGSIAFTLMAILVLAFLERRGRGLPEGRLGTAYVVAAALSILLLSKNRYAELGWLDLMKGEIITVSNFDLTLTAIALAVVLIVLGLFHKELMLVSFDRTLAVTLHKNVVFWDALTYLLIGFTVSKIGRAPCTVTREMSV